MTFRSVERHICTCIRSHSRCGVLLNNLMENAVKYGERAKVDVSESDRGVEIHVEDDGPGIPDPLQEEAFRSFRRLGTNMNVEDPVPA